MDEQQRLEAAKRILADPMINEAWDLLAKEILISWEHSSDHDVETRERLWSVSYTHLTLPTNREV